MVSRLASVDRGLEHWSSRASSAVDRGLEHWSSRLECGRSWVRALVLALSAVDCGLEHWSSPRVR